MRCHTDGTKYCFSIMTGIWAFRVSTSGAQSSGVTVVKGHIENPLSDAQTSKPQAGRSLGSKLQCMIGCLVKNRFLVAAYLVLCIDGLPFPATILSVPCGLLSK